MTPEIPNVTLNGRYSIGDIAKLLEVHRNTVRRWLDAGLMKAGIRRTNNRNFVEGREIIRFWKSQY